MLVAFPSGRLEGRFEHSLAVLGYFGTTVLQWAILLFVDTTRDDICGGCPANPLQAVDDQTVADALIGVQAILGIVLLVGVAFVLWRRWRSAGPSQRRVLGPVLATRPAGGRCSSALSLLWDLTGFSDTVEDAIDIAGLVALASIPFGFLVGLLRSRFSRAGAVSELVASLSERDDRRRGLRDALADALGDPGLTLAYWLPATRRVRERRRASPASCRSRARAGWRRSSRTTASRSPRSCTTRRSRTSGSWCARSAAPPTWRSRTSASTPSCAPRWRSCAPRGSGSWTRSSRAAGSSSATCTTVRSSGSCRSRSSLRMARSKLEAERPRGRRASCSRAASAELDRALAELRELARGIHPALLSDRGLEAALHSLAARAPAAGGGQRAAREPPAGQGRVGHLLRDRRGADQRRQVRAARAGRPCASCSSTAAWWSRWPTTALAAPTRRRARACAGLNDRVSALEGRLALESEAGRGHHG